LYILYSRKRRILLKQIFVTKFSLYIFFLEAIFLMKNPIVDGFNSIFKEKIMPKVSGGSRGGGSAPRGGKRGSGFIPSRPGGNKPSTTGNPSGSGRGNLPPKS
jgi:hypothetical protein